VTSQIGRAGATGHKLLRARRLGLLEPEDHGQVATAGWTYSIGVRQQQHIQAATAAIDETNWEPRFPSGKFYANARKVIAALAHNLLRWTHLIALPG